MATTPKTQKTRSKPSKTLAAALKRENNATVVKTGTVTAVRWDGTVNLMLGGQRFIGVACATSYTSRDVSDRVHVIMHGGMPFVMAAIGEDPEAPKPEIFPTQVKQFTWGRNGVANQEKRMFVNEGENQRVGRPGSLDPLYPGDDYYQAVFSYWDGTVNVMNDPADTAQSIDIFLARDEWDDEANQGPAYLELWAHKMDGLPDTASSILYQTALDPASIPFTLEPGEVTVINIPDTWRDSIGATTLNTDSIRGFTVRPQAAGAAPAAMDNSYAILTSMTCALRIYTPA